VIILLCIIVKGEISLFDPISANVTANPNMILSSWLSGKWLWQKDFTSQI